MPFFYKVLESEKKVLNYYLTFVEELYPEVYIAHKSIQNRHVTAQQSA